MEKAFYKKNENETNIEITIQHEKKETTRLNKYISSSGFCSRREADRHIESGNVYIDGIQAVLGDVVSDGQVVKVKEHVIQPKQKFVYIALHKPTGITCTTDQSIPGNICDFMGYPELIFPIGRLDKDSSGLILMSNDGDIVNKILRANHHHEKEYIVKVDKRLQEKDLQMLRKGIQIYNPVQNTYQVTNPAKVKKLGERTFTIILTQGLNRQIRRMCTALGYHVVALQRVRVMNIHLDLKVGEWRYLTSEELQTLNTLIQ